MAENNKPRFFNTTPSIIGPKATNVLEALYAFQEYIIANAVPGEKGDTGKGISSVEFIEYKEGNTIGSFKITYTDETTQTIDMPISTNMQVIKKVDYFNSKTPTRGDDFDFSLITGITIEGHYNDKQIFGSAVKQRTPYTTIVLIVFNEDYTFSGKILYARLNTNDKSIIIADSAIDVTEQCNFSMYCLVQGIN